MKTKLITLALLAVFGIPTQAQIVSSQSNQVIVYEKPKEPKIKKPRKPRNFKWNIRAGYSIDIVRGEYHDQYLKYDNASGFDVSFGIVKDFNTPNLLWGVDLGVMSHTYDCKWEGSITIETDLSPYIGYNIAINNNFSVVPYIGPYIGYQIGRHNTDFKATFAYGFNVGAELFVSKGFYFDVHYKHGFNNFIDGYYEKHKPSKIVFGVGYQF